MGVWLGEEWVAEGGVWGRGARPITGIPVRRRKQAVNDVGVPAKCSAGGKTKEKKATA